MMKQKIVFLDVDGTLVDFSVKESRGQPPSGTLEQAVKNGNFL